MSRSDQESGYHNTSAAVRQCASPANLYVFWAGESNIHQALGDAATFFTFPVAAKDPADAIAGNIATLASAGAKRFMWLNLPPLGEVPYISSNSNWFIRDLGREAGDRRRADLQQ